MKTQRFLLVAGILLAMVLTFSCSSDDEPGFPEQLYWGEREPFSIFGPSYEPYNGNGDITMVLQRNHDCSTPEISIICSGEKSEPLTAGKVQNGKVILNLPESIDSNYLAFYPELDWGSLCSDCEDLGSTLEVTDVKLYANLPDKGLCELELDVEHKSYYIEEVITYVYFSKSGKIKGIEENTTYDMDFSEGWNIVYRKAIHEDDGFSAYAYKSGEISTNPNTIGGFGKMTWKCRS
jgi:hypothetical protein